MPVTSHTKIKFIVKLIKLSEIISQLKKLEVSNKLIIY